MRKRILLVEDAKSLAKSIAEFLDMEGYEVAIVENGAYARAHLIEMSTDLIITDLVMPEMDGFEFIRQVRNEAKYDSIPIILLSAETSKEKIAKVYDVGANLVLPKPFDEEYLMQSIAKLLP